MCEIKVEKTQDYETLGKMAYESWHSAYDGLWGAKQVDYMLNKFQNAAAMRMQCEKQNYTYYFIVCGNEKIGYCGLQGRGTRQGAGAKGLGIRFGRSGAARRFARVPDRE